ncbi:DJ-1/PfpI family protein [Nonomuraea candida]|uniref:DJ-1/PfpI family protein n=1 Tax=Nonomuraea candida TaxID=359159 RepID=UPI000B117280|nr:DJ-1/PfpI family protein [Nonomuraea candida]
MTTLTVHTVLYDDVEDQDYIGPITAFGVNDRVRHTYVTVEGPRTITTASGVEITVRAPWAPEAADLILVPGGRYGEGSGVDKETRRGTLTAALAAARRPGLVLGAVCTGTLLLAAAGLIKGRPCATHRMAADDIRAHGGKLINARVVDDGDLVTSGGVTSGLDLGLWLTERFFGPEAALLAEQIMEYERRGTVWRTTT